MATKTHCTKPKQRVIQIELSPKEWERLEKVYAAHRAFLAETDHPNSGTIETFAAAFFVTELRHEAEKPEGGKA